MPTKYALDFRHVRDKRRRLVVAPCLGAETDELPRVEIIRYPLDDLAHGSALARSDIVRPVRVRRRQQAHEQVSNIRRVDEIPNLAAVALIGLPAVSAASNDGMRRRGSSPGP